MSALGPRGMTVLSVAGIAGALLAVAGWSHRDAGLVTPSAIAPPSAASSASAAPSTASAAPSPSSSPSSSPAGGRLLSSEPYASYAYLVWPGPLSADGKAALTGFTLNVTRQAGGITVRAVQDGQAMTSVSHFYAGGAKVYVLDSTLGDDGSGNVDYDEADDGLVVTNSRGQVLP